MVEIIACKFLLYLKNLDLSNVSPSFIGIHGLGCVIFFLLLQNPVAEDAGQYRCNIKNDVGETNANLTLNFEQEPAEQQEKDSASPRSVSRQGSRQGTVRLFLQILSFMISIIKKCFIIQIFPKSCKNSDGFEKKKTIQSLGLSLIHI